MIASLPMYWRAENAALWRAFWDVVQAQGVDLPDLTPPEDIPDPWSDHWLRPDLALSMTCGLPFRSVLRGKVTYVGTLDFGLKCAPGHYYSRILINKDAYARQRRHKAERHPPLRLAYNAPDSQSGWAVTQDPTPFVAPLRFTSYLETGSHAASLCAVADGRADICYVDAVTLRVLKRSGFDMTSVQLLGRSVTSPGLPLITALDTNPEPLRRALRDATQAFVPEAPLSMGGPLTFHVLDEVAYLDLPIPAPPPPC